MKMKKIRIGELSEYPFETRNLFWKELLASIEVSPIKMTAAEFISSFDALAKSNDAFIVSSEFSKALTLKFKNVPFSLKKIQSADRIIFENKRWWLHCFLRDALHEMIVKACPRLETRDLAYVTGPSQEMILSLSVLFQLGFRKIILVIGEDDFETFPKTNLDNFTKYFFGLNCEILDKNDLVLRPNDGSILINTVDLKKNPGMIEDISYLNFLKKNSLVVDFNSFIKGNPLAEETQNTDFSYLSGSLIIASADYNFLRYLDPEIKISKENYCEEWSRFSLLQNQS